MKHVLSLEALEFDGPVDIYIRRYPPSMNNALHDFTTKYPRHAVYKASQQYVRKMETYP